MGIYKKEFEVRWSDLDANRHVANSAYLNFMSHTRMAYLIENGFGHREMEQYKIGPVLFHEHVHYYKEIFGNKPIYVTLELKGASDDGMIFAFEHNIYSNEGKHHASCEIMGGFIDLQKRSLTALPEDLLNSLFKNMSKSTDYKVLTLEDTRKYGKKPKNRPELFEG